MTEENPEIAPTDEPRLTRPEQARRLLVAGVIDAGTAAELIRALRPVGAWQRWTAAHLLALGVALALAGVVCVFAHNYASLGRFAKLAILEGAVVAAAVAALWRGLEGLSGKVLLTVAAVLTGVLLAVYGQIYQTGADAWELFAGWLALITLWALAGRFAWLWLTWLAVACVALWLFFAQVVEPRKWFDPWWMWPIYAVLFAAALAGCEKRLVSGWRWWRAPALLAALLPLVGLGGWLLFSLAAGNDVRLSLAAGNDVRHLCPGAVALGLWAVLAAVGVCFYSRRAPDVLALALLSASAVALSLCAAFGLWLRFCRGFGEVGVAFGGAGLTLLVGWGWLWAWRRMRRWLAAAEANDDDDA